MTIWKNTGIRKKGNQLLLSLARGNPPITLRLPAYLAALVGQHFLEVRLVYDKAHRRYEWHIVIENSIEPLPMPGGGMGGVDLGAVHPAAITDGQNAMLVSCQEWRSLKQYWNKRLAELKSLQSSQQKHSRRWWRIQRRINRYTKVSQSVALRSLFGTEQVAREDSREASSPGDRQCHKNAGKNDTGSRGSEKKF